MDHPESDKLLGAVVFRSPTISRTLTPEAIPGSYNKELRSFHGSDKERGKVIVKYNQSFLHNMGLFSWENIFPEPYPKCKGFSSH